MVPTNNFLGPEQSGFKHKKCLIHCWAPSMRSVWSSPGTLSPSSTSGSTGYPAQTHPLYYPFDQIPDHYSARIVLGNCAKTAPTNSCPAGNDKLTYFRSQSGNHKPESPTNTAQCGDQRCISGQFSLDCVAPTHDLELTCMVNLWGNSAVQNSLSMGK